MPLIADLSFRDWIAIIACIAFIAAILAITVWIT
jgi:hypothetical protein